LNSDPDEMNEEQIIYDRLKIFSDLQYIYSWFCYFTGHRL